PNLTLDLPLRIRVPFHQAQRCLQLCQGSRDVTALPEGYRQVAIGKREAWFQLDCSAIRSYRLFPPPLSVKDACQLMPHDEQISPVCDHSLQQFLRFGGTPGFLQYLCQRYGGL